KTPRLQHIGLLRCEADRSGFGIHALSPSLLETSCFSLRFAALSFAVCCNGSSYVARLANTPGDRIFGAEVMVREQDQGGYCR
ncbi:MAG TPA: hypothetical protein PLE01_08125, partial [Syntrophothermus lipocalidus]|nr:hypothetical protein [Syntrophothermus lipocalidus]